MAFAKQIWTLMSKNFRSLILRQKFILVLMALVVPVVMGIIFSYARNLFVPPAEYGFGRVQPVKSLAQAFEAAALTGRDKFVLVNSGHMDGDIDRALDSIADAATAAQTYAGVPMQIVRVEHEDSLATECRSNLRGTTTCFGAVVMRSSPNEGPHGIWNYTIRSDGALSKSSYGIKVSRNDNPEQVYLLPVQHAVDSVIADFDDPGGAELAGVREYLFTSLTMAGREQVIKEKYQDTILNKMAIVFLSTVIWVTYHLTGFIATDRQTGISQLIDTMMSVPRPWMAQAARIISHHASFSILYAPGWILGAVIVQNGVYSHTNPAIVLVQHLLAGLALVSMSIVYASFFKKAQLSGVTATLVTIALGVLAQDIPNPRTVTVIVLSLLFTPCAHVYFITLMSRFERQGHGASLFQVAPDSPWSLPGIALWAFLVVQILVYPLIGALLERWFFGTSTAGRKVQVGHTEADTLGDAAVRLDGFTKVYSPPNVFQRLYGRFFFSDYEPQGPVVAVNKLSLSAVKGQIVALLGANGSGKSTTLDAIAGLAKLTGGSITVNGTGGLGIAPQKNVLWDDLTVEEHLTIFNRLKSPDKYDSMDGILDLIKSIDLVPKRHSLAKDLSGGQKRKLQLGMMLTGGSVLCCIDEVSSGVDPLSRRKIWDILLAERGRRTLIMTTHFLDEADLLADHIAILSKGTLRAEGSSVELKERHGGGYKVHVNTNASVMTPVIAEVKKRDDFTSTTYLAPSSSLTAVVIRELEAAGITDYRLSGPTIEDVFLQLAEEIKDEDILSRMNRSAELFEQAKSDDNLQEAVTLRDNTSPDDTSNDSTKQKDLKLMDSRPVGIVEQAKILFMKRFMIVGQWRWQTWFPYVLAFGLPILIAGLTSLYVKDQGPVGCSPTEQASGSTTRDALQKLESGSEVIFVAGPLERFIGINTRDLFKPIIAELGNGTQVVNKALEELHLVYSYPEFQEFIETHRDKVTTGFWLGDDVDPPTAGWVGNLAFTSCLSAQQFVDVLLTNTTIAAQWSPFVIPFSPDTGDYLQLVAYMGIALVCYPAFFALYPSNERRGFVRGLQYSNGVRPLPLWVAYLLFDLIIAVASAAVATAMWAEISNVWYHIGYLFVVFFLYAIASILLAYVVSLFTKTPLATFAFVAFGQGSVLLAYLGIYMSVLTFVPVANVDSSLLVTNYVISALAPIGSATRALLLVVNLFATACDDDQLSDNPGGILYYGGPILYLIVQSIFLFLLLLWLDGGKPSMRSLFNRSNVVKCSNKPSDEESVQKLDQYGLQVNHITKTFEEVSSRIIRNLAGILGKSSVKTFQKTPGKLTAVDDVTFNVQRGEVFALLGPNGAGKSTTISMIRGDVKPSGDGDIFVEDASVTRDLAAARANLGVCPQFDALDALTVREHLEFYARVRGIPDVEHNVRAVLLAVGLEAFEGRMAQALSGGNKRKLSLGIALMGNPAVLLLDEPSSGLDAAAKRIMWRTLAATVAGRSILLTTHSMEEADALAGRAGILAHRMLAVGTPDGLRRRFGNALHVHLVSSTAPRTSDEEMQRVVDWVRGTFPGAEIEAKTYHGQLRFSVRASQVLATTRGVSESEIKATGDGSSPQSSVSQCAIGQVFILLEEHKALLGIGHCSVSPTGLDQVFLTIVGNHNVEEENYEEKETGWAKFKKFRVP